ncbi:MAG: hypothetical protein AVDCRST_MAG49-1291, partial [uncultured Thermomicrobiales bacterium]
GRSRAARTPGSAVLGAMATRAERVGRGERARMPRQLAGSGIARHPEDCPGLVRSVRGRPEPASCV